MQSIWNSAKLPPLSKKNQKKYGSLRARALIALKNQSFSEAPSFGSSYFAQSEDHQCTAPKKLADQPKRITVAHSDTTKLSNKEEQEM